MKKETNSFLYPSPSLMPFPDNPSYLFKDLLRRVSRSFYLTLRVLPGKIRPPISLAYLLARTADTLADTEILPPHARLPNLLLFRKQFLEGVKAEEVEALQKAEGRRQKADLDQVGEAEMELLRRMNESFGLYQSLEPGDQKLVGKVVVSLTKAMEIDLIKFGRREKEKNNQALPSLETFDDLEDYTYHAAGCVGPFWTRMCMTHLSAFKKWNEKEMCDLGIRFGKALQWTNILRDTPKDLERGRCYLPSRELQTVGLVPDDLWNPSSFEKLKPLYDRYLDHALEHYRSAWHYALSIPKSSPRLRLACIWPLWIGLETVQILRCSTNPLDPALRIRIPRQRVYAIMALSATEVWSDLLLDAHCRKLFKPQQVRKAG